MTQLHQLRIYEIFEHNKQAFHDRFRDHAMRIMRSHGFEFVMLWETGTDERLEFAYLLAWPDREVMKTAWDAFMEDQEWNDIKHVTGAEHGTMVGEIWERVLTATDYSPNPRWDQQ
ncbi:MAG TPA: NIPSNAP family protein [Acidimicrobiia bacterium]|nr:NIPSNAP family protein [Acidimicrobiia bacterium]